MKRLVLILFLFAQAQGQLLVNGYKHATVTPINVALASNGGTASASTEYFTGIFTASNVNDGYRVAPNWGASGTQSGWNDGTPASWPDWIQIDFSASKTISEIDVFTLQDVFNSATDPTLSTTFTLYGATDYDVQYWNGSSWTTITSVSANNKVWRQFTFSPVTTTKIRVSVSNSADGQYSRIVELEAWGN